MKLKALILFLIIVFVAAGTVYAEDNVTHVSGDTFADIQNAVDNATGEDVLEIEGYYTSESSQINIEKTLTLQGKNAVLDGAKKSRIMEIKADNVVIQDITFKNGKEEMYGGAINLVGNNITLINCTFISNQVTYNGGAIYWLGYEGIISNCTFKSNTAGSYGGAISWCGPGESTNRYNPITVRGNERLTIENTVFNSNKAERGGAIYSNVEGYFIGEDYKDGDMSRFSPAEIINCDFSSNNAQEGGAIYWNECNQLSDVRIHANNLTVKKSRFTKNKADYGAAINLLGDFNSIIDSTFTSNNVKSGVVNIDGKNVWVVNSKFTSNTIKEMGALCAGCDNLKIEGCEFTKNTARNAPAICVSPGFYPNTNISVIKSKFTSNTAKSEGAVQIAANNVCIDGCEFTKNKADEGSSIYLNGFNQTVKNSKFKSNTATSYGGGIFWAGPINEFTSPSQIKNSKLEFINLEFTSNTADQSGAAITGNPTSRIFDSYKIKSGDNLNVRAIIKNCNFTKNTARFDGAVNWIGFVEDAKVHVSRLQVISCNFISNKATYGGAGALCIIGNNNNITDSNFNSNSARDFGGGAVLAEGSNLEVKNSKFTNNVARADGGAIFFTGSKLSVDGCEFTKNKVNPGFGSENGGAISLIGKNSVIKNSVFKNNYALDYGGALDISGANNVVKTSIFSGNTAEKGGAIYNSAKTGSINYCIFDNNRELDSNKYGILKYYTGNAVYANCNINSNFWGFNVGSGDFIVKDIVGARKPGIWVNLRISNNYLKFYNNKGKAVSQLPDYTFRLVDGKDKLIKTVKVQKGVGKVNLTRSFYTTTPTGVHVAKITKKLSATSKLTAIHQSGKKITIKTLKNIKVSIRVVNGKSVKPYHLKSNSKGIIKFDASQLNKGKNKLQIFINDKKFKSKTVQSTVTIKKAKANVNAPSVTRKYKKTGYFNVIPIHQTTKKRVKNTNIAIIVHYNNGIPVEHIIKTNKKGVASFNTKHMSKGTHMVRVISYGNFIMSKTSYITIK